MENKVIFERLNYLRLKDIAPVWSKLLEKKKFPFPFSLAWLKWYFLLDSPRNCIVGEAYNHYSIYQKNCEQCDELGWKFGHAFLVRFSSRNGKNCRHVRTSLERTSYI